MPGGVELSAWNAGHSASWNRLRTALTKLAPSAEYLRAIEVQARGALHDHAIVWVPEHEALPAVAQLRRLAISAGFGHSVDLKPLASLDDALAQYVVKSVARYVSKACDARDEVPWLGDVVNKRTGEITVGLVPATFRTWSSSSDWGTKMKQVRAESLAVARALDAHRRSLLADTPLALGHVPQLATDPDPPPALL
jgi:hypothetical protein